MNPKTPSSVYRPDIDGLRAFAVLAVVAYHAFPATLKSGFIGVDVFFVISGYLISGIIFNDLQQGTFSLWNFYSRRIRRIFPALIVVLAAALIFGWFALFPDEYRALGKHVFGGAAFISNFLFWQEAGYFAVAAKANPLLHLWSLGIEEQFYIAFPLLLWCCARKHLRTATVLVALCILSFLDNLYCMTDPAANFYNPLARVWELLAGAALCTAMRHPSANRLYLKLDVVAGKLMYDKEQENDGHSLSLALALSGVVFLGCALWLVRDGRPYPGWQALLPVLGTVFLISAGPLNFISKHLLANRLAVFIGLVSYPFYLWHWALISYAFIINGGLDASTRLLRVGLVAASFVLAVLTYFLVEKPIRFGTWARTGKIYVLIVGMVIVGLLGAVVRHEHGFSTRSAIKSAAEVLSHTQWDEDMWRNTLCQKRFKNQYAACVLAEDGHPTVALLGDSIANAYFPGFAEEYRVRGENLVQLGAGGCPPLLDITSGPAPARMNDWCKGATSKAIREVAAMPSIHTVFLAADWSLYVTGARLNGDYHDSWQIRHLLPEEIGESNADVFSAQLRKTLDLLVKSGKNVVFIKQPPAFHFNPLACLVKRPFSQSNMPCGISAAEEKKYLHAYESLLESILMDYPSIRVLDPFDIFFPHGQCVLFKDNVPLFRDAIHLSFFGSVYVARELMHTLFTDSFAPTSPLLEK